MTTLSDLIGRLRFNAGDRPAYDTIAGALNATDISSNVTFSDGSRVGLGGIVDFDDGSFEVGFASSKPTQTTAALLRGWESAKATHSAGAAVRLNPRYRAVKYREAINSSLAAISAAFGRNLWDTTQSFSSTKRILAVPAVAKQVIEVGTVPTGTTGLSTIYFDRLQSFPTALSATGKGVRLTSRNPGTGTAYIHYTDPWPALSAATDTLDTDFPADAEDLIVTGAQAYLEDADMFGRIAFAEPHTRDGKFVSQLADIRMTSAATMSRFIQRRSEIAASRPRRSPAWMRGG